VPGIRGPVADVVLNLSGANPLRAHALASPVRVLVDTDPVFTQVRHLSDPKAAAGARLHTAFFTFGENIGRPGCTIPDDALPWQPTRQPVLLRAWDVTPSPAGARFTTVMQWDSYPAAVYAGERFGMKSDSFGPYFDLPRRSPYPLEIALGRSEPAVDLLREYGWTVRSARQPTRDPWAYQRYIRGSAGEFTVAKHGYAISRSGWFSERSASYLASGRPVVTQDTGFTDWLETGSGVHSFRSPEEAVAALEAVHRAPRREADAARSVAERYFDSRHVLSSLLERATSHGSKSGG
jgi:hypothetical protein